MLKLTGSSKKNANSQEAFKVLHETAEGHDKPPGHDNAADVEGWALQFVEVVVAGDLWQVGQLRRICTG